MNPVLILTHNCLELTKKCVNSVQWQDVDTSIHVYDNESTDGTKEWLAAHPEIVDQSSGVDLGVSEGWNFVLDILFSNWKARHVLVLNNDTEIPSYFYRKLIGYKVPFVTGVSVDDDPKDHPDSWPHLAECPNFSAFLIRHDCWDKVGKFDENMKLYASDCDYHVRAHKLGIKLLNAGVPFHHERSSTMKYASPEERFEIAMQADRDRQVFREKWGCIPGEPAYDKLFSSEGAS